MMICRMLVSLAALLLPLTAHANKDNGPEAKVIDDWVYSCKGRVYKDFCSALALAPGTKNDISYLPMLLERYAFEEPEILFPSIDHKKQRFKIYVDNRLIGTFSNRGGNKYKSSLIISYADFWKLLGPVSRGNILTVRKMDNTIIGQASLTGATAVMKKIDRAQKMQSYDNALILKGEKKYYQPPVIITNRFSAEVSSANKIPPEETLQGYGSVAGCKQLGVRPQNIRAYDLPVQRKFPIAMALIVADCKTEGPNLISRAVLVYYDPPTDIWKRWEPENLENEISEIMQGPLHNIEVKEHNGSKWRLTVTRYDSDNKDCGKQMIFQPNETKNPGKYPMKLLGLYEMPICRGVDPEYWIWVD